MWFAAGLGGRHRRPPRPRSRPGRQGLQRRPCRHLASGSPRTGGARSHLPRRRGGSAPPRRQHLRTGSAPTSARSIRGGAARIRCAVLPLAGCAAATSAHASACPAARSACVAAVNQGAAACRAACRRSDAALCQRMRDATRRRERRVSRRRSALRGDLWRTELRQRVVARRCMAAPPRGKAFRVPARLHSDDASPCRTAKIAAVSRAARLPACGYIGTGAIAGTALARARARRWPISRCSSRLSGT